MSGRVSLSGTTLLTTSIIIVLSHLLGLCPRYRAGGRSVQCRIVGEGGHEGDLPTLAPQHPRPQSPGIGAEHVIDGRGENIPGALVDLVLQLTCEIGRAH